VGEPWKDLVSIPSSDAMGRGVIVSMAAGYEVTVWLESIRVSIQWTTGTWGWRGRGEASRRGGGMEGSFIARGCGAWAALIVTTLRNGAECRLS
jgi:hypothetical protein